MGENGTLFKDREPQKKKHTLSRATYLYTPHRGVPPGAAAPTPNCPRPPTLENIAKV